MLGCERNPPWRFLRLSEVSEKRFREEIEQRLVVLDGTHRESEQLLELEISEPEALEGGKLCFDAQEVQQFGAESPSIVKSASLWDENNHSEVVGVVIEVANDERHLESGGELQTSVARYHSSEGVQHRQACILTVSGCPDLRALGREQHLPGGFANLSHCFRSGFCQSQSI